MTLGELIEFLDEYYSDRPVKHGFRNPHSYRGHYDQIAFEPCLDTTVGDMLEAAQSAIDATFSGWKGGDYTMTLDTTVNIAREGRTGEEITEDMLHWMIGYEYLWEEE